jgi:hypothetical protein
MLRVRRLRGRAGLLIVLALGLLLTPVLPGSAQDQAAVSLVNDDPITRDAFHARMRFVRWQYLHEIEKLYDLTGGNLGLTPDYVNSRLGLLEDPQALGEAVLGLMEEDRLLWQTGERLSVTPAAEDAQAREADFFSQWTGVAADQLAQDDSAQAFIAQWFADAAAVSGMSEDDLHALFATEALRARLLDYLAANIPTEELAVHSRHILCAFHPNNVGDLTPPSAEQRAAAEQCVAGAQARLQAGEDFATVAADVSNDTASGRNGGDLGWVLVSYLVQPYADAVQDAEPNAVIGPVETEYGLHLIEVLERRMQPLTEAELHEARQGYFDLWLQTLRADAAIQRSDTWNADLPTNPALDTLTPEVLAAVNEFQAAQEQESVPQP